MESLTTRETRNRTQCEQNNERWLQPPTVLRKLKPLLIELRVSWPLLPGQIQLLLGFFAAVELQMTEAGSHSSKHFCVAPLQGGILPKSLKDHLQIAIGCSAPTLLCFTPPVSIQDHLHSFFLLPPLSASAHPPISGATSGSQAVIASFDLRPSSNETIDHFHHVD